MRFAIAMLTLLAAGALILAGIAQRTILKPDGEVSAHLATTAGAHYVVIPGSLLTAHEGRQRLSIDGAGPVFAAYGRTSDVRAWLSGQRYATVRPGTTEGALPVAQQVAPVVAGLTGGTPDPDGADLWLDQRSGQRSLDWAVNVPSDVSVLIAADGSAAAPTDIRVAWSVRTATPFAVPMIIGGGVLAVAGLLLYAWALAHVRRRRGPRRKPPAKLRRPPAPPKYRPQRPVPVGVERGRRSVRGMRVHRPAVALVAVAAGGALLTGWGARPAAAATPTPTASAAVGTATVTEEQAARIVRRIATVVADADAKRDADLLQDRVTGPAYDLRHAAYRIRKQDKKAALPQAIPGAGGTLGLVLPQASSTWPRTLFAIVEDGADSKKPPLALAMVQDDPRADYKVHYVMSIVRDAVLPDLPAATVGASRLDASTTLLRVPPAQLAADYGLLLRKPSAQAAQVFDTADDELAAGVGRKAKDRAVKRLGGTAKITFSDLAVDPGSVVALSTADSGALVSVELREKWTVKPKQAGVSVKPSGGTPILAGIDSTTKGVASTYGYQLLFSVPSAGSTKPVVLLGYAQGLVSAKEL